MANDKYLWFRATKYLLIRKTVKTSMNINTDSDKSLNVIAKFPAHKRKISDTKKPFLLSDFQKQFCKPIKWSEANRIN
jgi:hypothetical protein